MAELILPTQPAARILRAADAAHWIDGYAFMQAAEQQARQLTEDTRRQQREARAEAFEQARREGAEQAAARLAEAALAVDAYLAALEPALADLALNIACQVLGELDPGERLARCTRQALSAFRHDQALTLQVPAGELAGLRERLDREGMEHIKLAADERLAPGQASLCSAVGSVELGLETQLQLLRQNLLGQGGL